MSSMLFSLLYLYIISNMYLNTGTLYLSFFGKRKAISVRHLPCQIEGSSPPSLVPAKRPRFV